MVRRPGHYGLSLTLGLDGAGGPPAVDLTARYIIDADLDSDCDDLLDFSALCKVIRDDGGLLIAATACSNNTRAAACMSILLARGGFASTPVGAYQGTSIGGPNTSLYTLGVVTNFRPPGTDNRTNYPDAVTTLRTALAAAPDGTVKIVVTGTCTNIAALLVSAADGISGLTGSQLVAAKCSGLYIAAGLFTSSASEANIALDNAAAQAVADYAGCPKYWMGAEVGATINSEIPRFMDSTVDPFRYAWELSSSQTSAAFGRRPTWGTMAVLYMTRGLTPGFTVAGTGCTITFTAGVTAFTPNNGGTNSYLGKTATDAVLETYTDNLIGNFFIDLSAADIVAGTSTIDSDAATLFGRMTAQPTARRKALINGTIFALKANSVWTSFDGFYEMGADTAQASLLNWKGATYDLTVVGTVTHHPDSDRQGDGSTGYLETGWIPIQNSAHMGVWNLSSGTAAAAEIGNGPSVIVCYSAASQHSSRINSGAASTVGQSTGLGHHVTARASSTSQHASHNATQIGTNATASIAPGTDTVRICGRSSTVSYSARKLCFAHLGVNLTDGGANNLYYILRIHNAVLGR